MYVDRPFLGIHVHSTEIAQPWNDSFRHVIAMIETSMADYTM